MMDTWNSMSIRALIAVVLAVVAGSSAHAQITLEQIHSDRARLMAEAQAREDLAVDAELVLIGAVGRAAIQTQAGPIQLQFHPDSGTSSAWAYIFYSPSVKERITIIGISIPGIGLQVFQDESPVPIPDQIITGLDMKLPYATSGAMIERLRHDAGYTQYRQEFPSKFPGTIAFREIVSSDTLPAAFPINAPVWTLNFDGAGNAAMTCYVSGATGQTICMRAANVASSPVESRNSTDARMTVINDKGSLRVTVTAFKGEMGKIDAALFNTTGERVLEPAGITRDVGAWHIIFNTADLPSGAYYCRAAGNGWGIGEFVVCGE